MDVSLKIAICDDDGDFLDNLCRKTETILKDSGYETDILPFVNPSELLDVVHTKGHHNFDFVILDLEMPKVDGYNVASRIHAADPDVLVMFVTSHDEKVLDSFHYGAVGFIPKHQIDERLKMELLNAAKLAIDRRQSNTIAIDTLAGADTSGRRIVHNSFFSIRDITHVEAMDRDVIIHMQNQDAFAHVKSFSDLSQRLEKYGFIQIYRSITVNPRKIKSIHKDHVVITTDKSLPISRSIRSKLHEYIVNGMIAGGSDG